MDESPNVLDFVKAVSDTDRLRIIGVLAQHAATAKEVASELDMPFRQAFNHLAQLEFAGVIYKTDDAYSLNDEALEGLSRNQFSAKRQAYVPAPELDLQTRKVLTTYLNPDRSLKQIPLQGAKLRVILGYLVAAFEPGIDYTEKDVNAILLRFHADTASFRRKLVDAKLLAREGDGSRYWKVTTWRLALTVGSHW